MLFRLTAIALAAITLPIDRSCCAEQTLHSISLPGLTGTYSEAGQLMAVDFDFGMPFTAIEGVTLSVEFASFTETVCAGFSCTTGTFFNVAIREPGVITALEPDFGPAYGFSGHNSVIETRADSYFATDFIKLVEIDGQMTLVSDTAPIDVLNDGRGSIALRLSGGPAKISNIQLQVLSNAIPEPSSLVLGTVLLALVSIRRKRESTE